MFELWHGCRAVTLDPSVVAWLCSRRIEVRRVVARDLARALPGPLDLSLWARQSGEPWKLAPRGLVAPLYNAYGSLETLHVQPIDPSAPGGPVCEGTRLYGQVLADAAARRLLEGRPMHLDGRTVVVAQGLPEFLDWATSQPSTEDAPVVLGVINGGWTAAVAARIPDGARVLVRTREEVVDRNAHRVVTTLGARCQVIVRRS